MAVCDECGSDNLIDKAVDGVSVIECGLCGAITGDDDAVTHVLRAQEARNRGMDPTIYPLVQVLDSIRGISVVRSDPGDVEAMTWPMVQIAGAGDHALVDLENLTKSLAMANQQCEVHWVLELEYQNRLVLTLKPRFHTDVDRIRRDAIGAARRDLDRLRRCLERDQLLSWWVR